MKLFRTAKPAATPQRRRGIALIIVLAMLSLMTVLIVAIFTTAGTERLAASGYANGVYAKTLSDTVLNLAIGQITHATKSYSDATDPSTRVAWASQPGMIRTYDSAGNNSTIYKLYSGDDMIGPDSEAMDDTRNLPTTWNKDAYTSIYTDLNAPVMVTDPANANIKKAIYPIMDPLLSSANVPLKPGEPGFVDGFGITNAPGYSGNNPSPSNNPAPMPVKWLYVLKDGALATAVLTGTTVKIKDATLKNPIVGRIAFWADDETAKVNMNTASEGTYWDVPRIYTYEDYGQFTGSTSSPAVDIPGLSIAQPAQKEFQRYPGHPATTSLSPVLGSVMPVPDPQTNVYPTTSAATIKSNAANYTKYYNLVPRIGTGGSNSGTDVSNKVLTTEANRLFATYDELLFTPVTTTTRAVNANITPSLLEKTKFFLTASSNAPETTLFNTPRVAIWPVHATASRRTLFDQVMAFCATIANKPYHFTRSNPRSATDDYTGRNVDLYKYLQALTSRPIPGYGGKFDAKYGGTGPSGATERDQILTSIFDYIRSTNLQDKTENTPGKPIESFTKQYAYGSGLDYRGAGEVVPIKIGQTRGFGRFYTVSEASLLFYGTKADATRTTAMRAVFLVELATPSQGMAPARKKIKYRVTGLDKLKVKFGVEEKSLQFKGTGVNYTKHPDLETWHGRDVGGQEGANHLLAGKSWNDADAGADSPDKYPFHSALDIDIPSGTTFDLVTGNTLSTVTNKILVEIMADDGAGSPVLQTIELAFPNGNFAVPGVGSGGKYGSRDFTSPYQLVYNTDVVVSLHPAGRPGLSSSSELASDATAGDVRMIAPLEMVPYTKFRVHNNYLNPGVRHAHTLLMTVGEVFEGGIYGKLAPIGSLNYQNPGTKRQPDVPPSVTNGVKRDNGGPGDWDSGFGDQKDGAYINKPDEGDTKLTDVQNNQYRPPYLLGYNHGHASASNIFFSPNRQVPSPLMFGSLPTGVQRDKPWQTLLFHPRPEDTTHPGNKITPPDHLLADLFWMPVIEPYAESQAFSTAGKINMNYQILPFSYIRRDTGLRAVLKSTKFLAMQASNVNNYKPIDPGNTGARVSGTSRYAIDLPNNSIPETFKPFDTKFAAGEIFKSATQICEMNLVPKGQTAAGMAGFWNNNLLTGDNVREKPYVDIYPRLTTKSNVYTIHARVQALQKSRSTDPSQWDATKDQIVSEVRTSSVVERYITINDTTLPDWAAPNFDFDSAVANIDQYYKMRVLSTKRFAP